MPKPLLARHGDGSIARIDLDRVPYELITIDDAGSLRVAADWLLERGHADLPRFLVATADLWDAGCGLTFAELAAWFERWRAGDPPIPQPAVWCRFARDKWSRCRLESLGRLHVRCRRERRGMRSTGSACTRAWWDVHRRLPGNVRPVVELHQYDARVNIAFAAALRRRATH